MLRKWKRACNNSLASLLLPLTLMLSACDVQGLSSDAYILGKETGATWRDLSDEIEVISSWVDEESGDLNAISETDKLQACRGMWLLVGWPTFGLEDMSDNRQDFIDGCLTSIGS